MTSQCASPIRGKVYRIVGLDICGVPGTSQVVSKFASIDFTSEYQDGEETNPTNADGSPCFTDKAPNYLKRIGASIKVCNIDPDGIVLITGERLLGAGSPVTGTGVAFGEGLLTARFSLEVWQDVAGAGACDASGVQRYFYWAFPNMGNPKIGNYTIDKGSPTLEFTADTKAASPLWGDGPGTVSWLPTGAAAVAAGRDKIASDEHFAFNITTVAPPTPTCGATAVA